MARELLAISCQSSSEDMAKIDVKSSSVRFIENEN